MSPSPCRPVLTFILCLFVALNGYGQSTSYRARYTSIGGAKFSPSQQTTAIDGGIILAGTTSYTGQTSAVMVMKLDPYGNIGWSRSYNTNGQVGPIVIRQLSDGTIALMAQVEENNNNIYTYPILVMELNCKGQLLWSEQLSGGDDGGKQFWNPGSIREGQNGDILLAYFSYSSTASLAVCRMDNSGKIIWSKNFNNPFVDPNLPPNLSVSFPAVAFYQDNSVLLLGQQHIFENALYYSKILFAEKMEYATGKLVDQKAYDYSENPTAWGYFGTAPDIDFDAEQLADGRIAMFGIFDNFSQQNSYLYRIDINGDLSYNNSQFFTLSKDLGIPYSAIRVTSNGQTHISAGNYDQNLYYWYTADNNGNMIRSVAIPFSGVTMGGSGLYPFQTAASRTSLVVPTFTTLPAFDILQVEDGNNAIASCLGSPASFVQGVNHFNIATGVYNFHSVNDNKVVATSFALNATDFSYEKNYLCAPGQPAPAAFTILGPAAICNPKGAYTFHVSTNPAGKPVQWSMDPSQYQSFTTLNDSTVSIVFDSAVNAPAQATLQATGSDCSQTVAALTIALYPGAILPSHATICKTGITLHAGYWFSSYLWQDGSTDSVYTVSKPGQYILQLQTNCGETIMDTINVYNDRIGGFLPVNLCQNDTAVLIAPGGFTGYNWSPDYNLVQLNDTLVEVYPQIDTAYVLSSSTLDGCSLHDTIPVMVKKAPVVDLGQDTTLCQFDQLNLNAGIAGQRYEWSTGASSSGIIATPPGLYYVTVTNSDGCRTSDTIALQSKYCPDLFAVPNAFTPDGNGANDLFRPHIAGRMESYLFVVYNRWGGIVFETKNPAEGWDGRYNGVIQSPGTYPWMCRYKFSDQGVKTEKGTAILIR